MANISKIKLPNGTTYNLKDTVSGYTTNTGTVTKVSTGKGLTGGDVTTTGTIKANLNSETSLGTIGTTDKLYAVGVDANNKLCVNVPWTDSTVSTLTLASGSTAGTSLTYGGKFTLTVGSKTVSFTMPASDNTDTKVTQAYSTANNNYPLLATATAGASSTSSRGATTAILNNGIFINPSEGRLSTDKIEGISIDGSISRVIGNWIPSSFGYDVCAEDYGATIYLDNDDEEVGVYLSETPASSLYYYDVSNMLSNNITASSTGITVNLGSYMINFPLNKSGTVALTSDMPSIPSNNVTGSGTSGQLAQWNGTNTLTSGPKVTISTSTPSGGSNGDIWFVYS